MTTPVHGIDRCGVAIGFDGRRRRHIPGRGEVPLFHELSSCSEMKDLTGQAPRYLKDRILGLRLRALSDKTGYAASGGELTSREIKLNDARIASWRKSRRSNSPKRNAPPWKQAGKRLETGILPCLPSALPDDPAPVLEGLDSLEPRVGYDLRGALTLRWRGGAFCCQARALRQARTRQARVTTSSTTWAM